MRTLFVLAVMTAKAKIYKTTRNLNILLVLLSVTSLFVVVWLPATKDYRYSRQRYQPSPFCLYCFNGCMPKESNESKYTRGCIPKVSDESKYTKGSQSFMWTKRVQLCIMFNLKNMSPRKEVIDLLLLYYSIFFDHIMLLFDGDWNEKPSYIPTNISFSGCKSSNGWFQQRCLPICFKKTWVGKEPVGYLYISDDMFINLTMMSSLPLSKMWYLETPTIHYKNKGSLKDWHWNEVIKPLETVIRNLPEKWKRMLVKSGFPDSFHASGTADVVYVPHSLAENMTDVVNYIDKTANLFCEVALPLAVDIVAPTNQAHFVEGYLWGGDKTLENMKKKAETAHFVHPIKLTNKDQANLWISSMEKVKAAVLHK